jgi:hypothetical protein
MAILEKCIVVMSILEKIKDEFVTCCSGSVTVAVVDDDARGLGDAMALYLSISLISSMKA